MKRMLINATHSEEIRVAIANGQKLFNLDIDVPGHTRKKGNIYKAKITRVEPSLEAAFVDYGSDRHGFLPFKEISRTYYTPEAQKSKDRPTIAVAVKEGTEIIIQVTKEERGNKGAAVSTYISLAGRYLVYMPENPKSGGISRRIEGKTRQDLKEVMAQVKTPKNAGVIVRTAGVGRSVEEIDWDLNYLDQVWTAIKTTAASRSGPFFIYQESDLFIRALRDYLRPDIGEILIDDKAIYDKAYEFMQQVMPHNLKKLSYYNDSTPLFSRYQIEGQIQSAFSREVHLPSGGSLVIDHTEAMIAIDINSARATKGSDIEETALNTNLEAAEEIARQLRIRDLGGLVVIDFIDMRNHKNQRLVENKLNESLSSDRARVQTAKISRFGLMEMSRQRLRSSINESSQFVCPRCSGHGFIRNIESLAVSILRVMEEEALKPDTGKVVAQVPTKVANFIMNEKRDELASLESNHRVPMIIVANEFFQTPQYDITRMKTLEAKQFQLDKVELQKPEDEELAESRSTNAQAPKQRDAAIDLIKPQNQVPTRTKSKSILSKIVGLFTTKEESKPKAKPKTNQRNNNNYKGKKKPYNNRKNNSQGAKPNPNQKNKKPQHNKPNPNAKKPQVNKNTATQKPKAQAKPQATKNNNKPQVSKAQANHKKPQHNHKKQAPQKEAVQNKQIDKPINDKTVAATPSKKLDDKMTRPLGSVASYAASKTTGDENSKTINAPAYTETAAQTSTKSTTNKATENKPTTTKKANTVSDSKTPVKKVVEKPLIEAPKTEAKKETTLMSDAKDTKPKATTKKKTAKKATSKKTTTKKATNKKVASKKTSTKKVATAKATKPKALKKPAEPSLDFDVKVPVSKAKATAKPKPKAEKPKIEKAKQVSIDFDL